ncbi:hypothetical protein M0D69_07980, partial [Caballeronia sp. SEWSISQ10-4 2]|uniref:hypothetical protein n=1 Tax=Caballeronia sp. SEWSISQ10-4 2 TaxID=2937438 RepID=UPI002650AE6E
QRLVLDGAVLTVAAPQQVGAIDPTLVGAGRGDDVSSSGSRWHTAKYRQKSHKVKYFSDYKFN